MNKGAWEQTGRINAYSKDNQIQVALYKDLLYKLAQET